MKHEVCGMGITIVYMGGGCVLFNLLDMLNVCMHQLYHFISMNVTFLLKMLYALCYHLLSFLQIKNPVR